MPERKEITFQDVRIVYRNFAGRKQPFNQEGERNFSIVIPADLAEQLNADGWNAKYREPRDEDEEGMWHLPVKVSYMIRPPRIVMVTSTGKTHLPEDLIHLLDFADIQSVDCVVSGSFWDVNGKTGYKAYAQTVVVIVNEDEIERKYGLNSPDLVAPTTTE
jgi:hypothetical protein